MNVADVLFVGYDDKSGDIPVLTVAKRVGNEMKFVNVLQGPEAREIHQKLTTATFNLPDGGAK